MRTGRYHWMGSLALLLLALLALVACGDDGDEATMGAAVGSPADAAGAAVEVDFAPELGTIDNWYNGDSTTLSDLRGTPVLLVFWADY